MRYLWLQKIYYRNILDAYTSRKRPKKKERENYRPYSGDVGGGEETKEINYHPYSRVDGE
jgi:hypothetical protein